MAVTKSCRDLAIKFALKEKHSGSMGSNGQFSPKRRNSWHTWRAEKRRVLRRSAQQFGAVTLMTSPSRIKCSTQIERLNLWLIRWCFLGEERLSDGTAGAGPRQRPACWKITEITVQ